MNCFIYFQRLYNIFILFHCVTAYVLFAANLDDFKSIAKKFIPAKLADQLADMASPTSIKRLHETVENSGENPNESNENIEEEDLELKDKEIPTPKLKKRFSVESQTTDINIDEIVEKVRIKLEKEFKNFRNTPKTNHGEKMTPNNAVSLKHKQKPMRNVIKEIIYENVPNENEYEQDTNEKTAAEEMTATEREALNINERGDEIEHNPSKKTVVETTEIENLFQEIDMRKTNDSYEDYITPKRDEIYENGDTEHSITPATEKHAYSPKNKVIRYVDRIKWKAKEKATTPTYDYREDVKAKTESIVYDDTEIYANHSRDGAKLNSSDEVSNRPIDGAVHKIKKPVGTMIPTREIYKMSSPNYYAKLPTVAEKYNFDEPLPERDRVPENLKYIGNPPASVNRKVKL